MENSKSTKDNTKDGTLKPAGQFVRDVVADLKKLMENPTISIDMDEYLVPEVRKNGLWVESSINASQRCTVCIGGAYLLSHCTGGESDEGDFNDYDSGVSEFLDCVRSGYPNRIFRGSNAEELDNGWVEENGLEKLYIELLERADVLDKHDVMIDKEGRSTWHF